MRSPTTRSTTKRNKTGEHERIFTKALCVRPGCVRTITTTTRYNITDRINEITYHQINYHQRNVRSKQKAGRITKLKKKIQCVPLIFYILKPPDDNKNWQE